MPTMFNQKGFLHIGLITLILIGALIAGVYLTNNKQLDNSKAAANSYNLPYPTYLTTSCQTDGSVRVSWTPPENGKSYRAILKYGSSSNQSAIASTEFTNSTVSDAYLVESHANGNVARSQNSDYPYPQSYRGERYHKLFRYNPGSEYVMYMQTKDSNGNPQDIEGAVINRIICSGSQPPSADKITITLAKASCTLDSEPKPVVDISWQAFSNPALSHYNIQSVTDTSNDANLVQETDPGNATAIGKATTKQILQELNKPVRYYRVVARGTSGNALAVSDWSTSIKALDCSSPPKILKAIASCDKGQAKVSLSFQGAISGQDISHLDVYRKSKATGSESLVTKVNPGNNFTYTVSDETIPNGVSGGMTYFVRGYSLDEKLTQQSSSYDLDITCSSP